MADPFTIGLGVGSFALNAINLFSNNSAQKKQAKLQADQVAIQAKGNKQQANLAIDDLNESNALYSDFLSYAKNNQSFAGLDSLNDFTSSTDVSQQGKALYSEVYRNMALHDVIGGATGRVGGSSGMLAQQEKFNVESDIANFISQIGINKEAIQAHKESISDWDKAAKNAADAANEESLLDKGLKYLNPVTRAKGYVNTAKKVIKKLKFW